MKAILFALALLSSLSLARPLTTEEKQSELRSIYTVVQSQYGPYEYKKSDKKLDLDGTFQKYLKEAESVSTVEFYYLINRFIAEFQDSHFSSTVNTDQVAQLGFLVDLVQGKALVDEVDRKLLPESKFPFVRGDELISIDGIEIQTLAEELSRYKGAGNPETARRSGTILTTFRPGNIVPIPFATYAKVTLRHGTSDITETLELDWNLKGSGPFRHSGRTMDYSLISSKEVWEGFPETEKNFRCSGTSRIKVPNDAKMLIEKPFVAYYHPTPKGNIGYLRIPHYNWKNEHTGEAENDLRFSQYQYVISQLEKNTVGLIIDQDHNCGGNVDLVENMVGLFVDKPYVGLEFQFMASRNEYLLFSKWLKDSPELTLGTETLKEVQSLIKATWEEGKSRLTPKTTFMNNFLLTPNPHRYTKPVVVLIDEMSGSGGDAFPGMMQGLGRAKLFGKRTMGAGGHVEEQLALPYSGNNWRMTKSLFYHPNGTPIENHGASPDYPYEITRDDFLYGYRDYQKKYEEVLTSLLP